MDGPLKILIVEDSKDDALLMVMELRRMKWEVTHERVDTAAAMRAALDARRWDVIIADYSMPNFSGPAALALAREYAMDVPFILVSGTMGEETAVHAMKAGADDYLYKGDLRRLAPAIEREMSEAAERRRVGRHTKELEQRVRDRTADLERSNAALEQFAYTAAHDLQAPLNTVIGYMERLGRTCEAQLNQESMVSMTLVVDATERMQLLIRSVLAYSRLKGGTPPDVPTESAVAYDLAVDNLAAVISNRGAVVERGDLPAVYADPTQLMQVFQNLIHNAIKFISADKPRINVTAVREGENWIFSVKDNGLGIDPANKERIFNLFERLHGHDDFPGTGIGLAVCKKIVHRHGGKIWVESTLGNGATFHFTLPTAAVVLN